MALTRATTKQVTHKGPATGDAVQNVYTVLESLNTATDAVEATVATLDTKLDGWVSVKDFGAVGDGVADDTAAIQAAVNFAITSAAGRTVYVPAGKYKLTSQININNGMSLVGESPQSTKAAGGIGGGTWFHIAHTGKGFNVANTVGYFTDVRFSHLGTYRTQPASTSGWAPTAHDFDFNIAGAPDVNFFDVFLLNPTKGISVNSGGGRVNFDMVRGQPMEVGIDIQEAYDVCKFHNIHFWPFWSDTTPVHTYMLANLNGIKMGRCDNPMLTNIFTIFAHTGIRLYQNAYGATSKIHVANADFDAGIHGIYVDSTVTNGVSGQFSNITFQGYDGSTNSIGLRLAGTSSVLSFSSLKPSFCGANGIRVDGSNNIVTISDATILYYDRYSGGFPAVEVANTNRVSFGQKPYMVTTGTGGKYGGAGRISVDEWRDFTPNFYASTGALSTIFASFGLYKVVDDTVYVKASLRVNNNGSGSASIHMSVPVGSPTFPSVGCGREIALFGKTLNVQVTQAVGHVIIVNYDNTYPAANGAWMDVDFSYTI